MGELAMSEVSEAILVRGPQDLFSLGLGQAVRSARATGGASARSAFLSAHTGVLGTSGSNSRPCEALGARFADGVGSGTRWIRAR